MTRTSRRSKPPSSWLAGRVCRLRRWTLSLLLAAFVASTAGLFNVALQAGPDLQAACDAGTPYLVTACYRGLAKSSSVFPYDADAPSVVVFSDTPDDEPYFVAATYEQVGAIWGLAYRGVESAVYAAAFHKTQLPFGPGGPGAIYRIDLESGDIRHFLTVPNVGPDRHERRIKWDKDGEAWAGRSALGDLDLNTDETELYVVNLSDRRVYRYAMPLGQLLGSFPHGAQGEAWADEARPFALTFQDGFLYHGLVRTAEVSQEAANLEARVYRSRSDGSQITQVAAFDLDYDRGTAASGTAPHNRLDWRPWRDNEYVDRYNLHYSLMPMPLLSDITFDETHNIVLGLRDRYMDASRHFHHVPALTRPLVGSGVGDLLLGVSSGQSWTVDTSDEHFQAVDGLFGEESALGGLARLSSGRVIVSGSHVGEVYKRELTGLRGEGAYWYDAEPGDLMRHESVCSPAAAEPLSNLHLSPRHASAHNGEQFREIEARAPGSVGDMEVLCSDVSPPTPSHTPEPPTATQLPTQTGPPSATPSPMPTATATPTSTPTPRATPQPIYVPLGLREHCDPDHRRADIALVLDTSSSMTGANLDDAKAAALLFVGMIDLEPGRSQVAVVRYDREAEVVRELTRSRALIDAAIRSLQVRSGTHIDKGLRAALSELQSPRHLDRNVPVMILLTDGLQTGTPGEELRAAAEVRDAGVRLYTIGLGADVDETALMAMAGDGARYYHAPDSADLARIYGEIAQDLMCPGKQLWGGR